MIAMRDYFRLFVLFLLIVYGVQVPAQRLKLFSQEQRVAANHTNAIVMDFLERYFNELPQVSGTTVDTKMADDKVFFRKGTFSDLFNIADTMQFSISMYDRYYEEEWKTQDVPFVTIVFPIQYDLLLGMHQEEAQRKLKDSILAAPQQKVLYEIPDHFVMLDDSIYMSKTGFIELESMNDAIYYNKVGESYNPFFHMSHSDYSAANLFHGLIDGVDYRMHIEQSVYGMKSISYTISLRQWINYCALWGLKVYFAVEEQHKDGLLALVIAQSKEFGFNHMLSVVIPDKYISDNNAVLKVRLTSYIPTHNVKSLFKKESVNRRKIKWQ